MSESPGSEKRGWFTRLRGGLARSSSKLAEGIGAILTKRRLDEAMIGELEELLIGVDLGVSTAARLTRDLAKARFDQEVTAEEVKERFAEDIAAELRPYAKPLAIDPAHRPHVMLVVGVNGSGKTTTIGKLARLFAAEGNSVWLAAGDTFRAAAVEQLKIWGERAGAQVIAKDAGADAAGLAFEALERAKAAGADVLLIDTAGRLHNKADLMAELQKIVRVIKKIAPEAPHDTLLVLDATTGQNAHAQVETFRAMVEITGLILAKLDGTARGGVLVALAERFKLPVHAIGIGEGPDDLRPFDARAFARSLFDLSSANGP